MESPEQVPPRKKRRRPTDKAQPKAGSTARPRRSSPEGAESASERAAQREARSRRLLISGSGLLLLGLGMVGVDTTDVGAGVTLLGLVILIAGIHTFGRLGPDEPALPDASSP